MTPCGLILNVVFVPVNKNEAFQMMFCVFQCIILTNGNSIEKSSFLLNIAPLPARPPFPSGQLFSRTISSYQFPPGIQEN